MNYRNLWFPVRGITLGIMPEVVAKSFIFFIFVFGCFLEVSRCFKASPEIVIPEQIFKFFFYGIFDVLVIIRTFICTSFLTQMDNKNFGWLVWGDAHGFA